MSRVIIQKRNKTRRMRWLCASSESPAHLCVEQDGTAATLCGARPKRLFRHHTTRRCKDCAMLDAVMRSAKRAQLIAKMCRPILPLVRLAELVKNFVKPSRSKAASLACLTAVLLLAAPSARSVTLAWDDPNDATYGITGYNIYEHIGATYFGVNAQLITPMTQPTYVLPPLSRGTHYFVATAVNPDAESGYSNEVTVVQKKSPSAPTNLRVVDK
jgi:hypothetical protein